VTDRERVKLLFGPYKAPPLKRGDRAFCLVRDCEVIITSWTDALIPWPRCRAVDSPGPGSGLLVDEGLARAVTHQARLREWGLSPPEMAATIAPGVGTPSQGRPPPARLGSWE
jgi:hypothetical protein